MKNEFTHITEECRNDIKAKDNNAATILIKHYEPYIRSISHKAIVILDLDETTEDDLMQELYIKLLASTKRFNEKYIEGD